MAKVTVTGFEDFDPKTQTFLVRWSDGMDGRVKFHGTGRGVSWRSGGRAYGAFSALVDWRRAALPAELRAYGEKLADAARRRFEADKALEAANAVVDGDKDRAAAALFETAQAWPAMLADMAVEGDALNAVEVVSLLAMADAINAARLAALVNWQAAHSANVEALTARADESHLLANPPAFGG